MKLTGAIAQDFGNWLYDNYDLYNVLQLNKFDQWPMDSQWGFFQTFADSVGYDLVVFRWQNKFSASVYKINYHGLFDKCIWQNDKSKKRDQARIKCMDNFIRIYNDVPSNI